MDKTEKKRKYTAKVDFDEDTIDYLSSRYRPGKLVMWDVIYKKHVWPIWLIMPDLKNTDLIAFNLSDEDEANKDNDIRAGDTIHLGMTYPEVRLVDMKVIAIRRCKPIYVPRIITHKSIGPEDELSVVLYHGFEERDENGWFKVDDVISHLSRSKPFDLQMLEQIVDNDEDHRYILSEDKTKIRISPEHPAPKVVEEEMKKADDIKISRSMFRIEGLSYVKDTNRKIVITSDDGGVWKFPYRTNKVFYIDEKHFFMLLEFSGGRPALAVCSYLTKNGHYRYRMKIMDWPDVINYFFVLECELSDYEGRTYTVRVEQKK